MKKLRLWVKRPVNNNFVLLMGIVLFLLLFVFVSCFTKVPLTEKIEKFSLIIDKVLQEKPDDFEKIIDSVENLALEVGSVADFVMRFIFVYMPLFIAVIVFVQAAFARIIFSNKSNERLVCYRVFMAITLITTGCLCFGYSLIFFNSLITGLLAVAADAVLIYIIVRCIKNTYTSRIKE